MPATPIVPPRNPAAERADRATLRRADVCCCVLSRREESKRVEDVGDRCEQVVERRGPQIRGERGSGSRYIHQWRQREHRCDQQYPRNCEWPSISRHASQRPSLQRIRSKECVLPLAAYTRHTTCRYDDTAGTTRGNVTTTVVPLPGSDESEMSAPCSLAIQLAIESPSPAPSVLPRAVSPRKNR